MLEAAKPMIRLQKCLCLLCTGLPWLAIRRFRCEWVKGNSSKGFQKDNLYSVPTDSLEKEICSHTCFSLSFLWLHTRLHMS